MNGVDLWINNAGVSTSRYAPLVETTTENITQVDSRHHVQLIRHQVITTNVIGTLFATQTALKASLMQQSPVKIILVDGAGSNQSATPNYLTYGFSKAGIPQLMKSLLAEISSDPRLAHVSIHTISPGTQLLSSYFVTCFTVL